MHFLICDFWWTHVCIYLGMKFLDYKKHTYELIIAKQSYTGFCCCYFLRSIFEFTCWIIFSALTYFLKTFNLSIVTQLLNCLSFKANQWRHVLVGKLDAAFEKYHFTHFCSFSLCLALFSSLICRYCFHFWIQVLYWLEALLWYEK